MASALPTLLAIHSYFRFLVLLVGLVALAVHVLALLQREEFAPLHRKLGAAYSGMLQIQLVLGFVAYGAGSRAGIVIGHAVVMFLGVAILQGTLSFNRRRSPPKLGLPTLGIALSLLFIFAGIAALARGPFAVSF